MSKATAGDVISGARLALNDPSAVRWTNAVLFGYILAAEQRMSGDHPECQYDTKVENPEPVLLTQLTDSTTIVFGYLSSLIHYVAYRCFLEDSDDAANQKLAMNHLQLYKDNMGDK